VGKYKEG